MQALKALLRIPTAQSPKFKGATATKTPGAPRTGATGTTSLRPVDKPPFVADDKNAPRLGKDSKAVATQHLPAEDIAREVFESVAGFIPELADMCGTYATNMKRVDGDKGPYLIPVDCVDETFIGQIHNKVPCRVFLAALLPSESVGVAFALGSTNRSIGSCTFWTPEPPPAKFEFGEYRGTYKGGYLWETTQARFRQRVFLLPIPDTDKTAQATFESLKEIAGREGMLERQKCFKEGTTITDWTPR